MKDLKNTTEKELIELALCELVRRADIVEKRLEKSDEPETIRKFGVILIGMSEMMERLEELE